MNSNEDHQSIFDSFSSSSKMMGKEEFVSEIVPKIQEILKRTFPGNRAKQNVKIHHDRLSFAAPCCGDSAHNNFKKRGNIILEGKFKNLYKCFNCGTCMSVQKFLKQYGQDMSMEMVDYISSNKADVSTFRPQAASSIIYDEDTIEELAIDRDQFRHLLNLTECSEQCKGKSYLINRKQYDLTKFMYSTQEDKLFILNLTKSGKIFGIQVRHFDGKSAKYKTYGLQKIHQMILMDDVIVPDDINELSMVFNILLVDYSQYITVVEGPMDSFLLRNSIALCGAGKHIEFPFMVRYLFDDDKPGREHAIEKMREGYDVFMWDSYKKDLGIRTTKKLDINDMVIWCSDNNMKMLPISDYFSNDLFNLINL